MCSHGDARHDELVFRLKSLETLRGGRLGRLLWFKLFEYFGQPCYRVPVEAVERELVFQTMFAIYTSQPLKASGILAFIVRTPNIRTLEMHKRVITTWWKIPTFLLQLCLRSSRSFLAEFGFMMRILLVAFYGLEFSEWSFWFLV